MQDVDIDKLLLIAVPALSGLTFLAYKHPKAYEKLGFGLFMILLPTIVVSFIWGLSNNFAYTAAIPYIPSDKIAEATKAINGERLLSVPLFVSLCLLAGYLLFFWYLPELLARASR